MENYNTLDNNYDIIQTLDESKYTRLYSVTNMINHNEYIALARINDDQDNFQHELHMTTMASGLNHPNLIHLVGHGVGTLRDRGKVFDKVNYLILESCPRGVLSDYVQYGRFTERQAKYIFRKILLGVQALHGAGYCHRQLRVDNILLDQNFNPKIINFNFTTLFQQNNQPILLNDFIDNRQYSSPQNLEHEPYNGEKADIFSLGAILFTLVTGKFGFESAKKNDTIYSHIYKDDGEYWNIHNSFHGTVNFKNLYISMVDYHENKRPNISQVLSHHWFDEINNLDNQELGQLQLELRNEFLARFYQITQLNQNLNNIHNNDNNNNGNNDNNNNTISFPTASCNVLTHCLTLSKVIGIDTSYTISAPTAF